MTTVKSAIERLRAAAASTADGEIATVVGAMRVEKRDHSVSTWCTWVGGERVEVSVVVTRTKP